jgi:hypothetical protein
MPLNATCRAALDSAERAALGFPVLARTLAAADAAIVEENFPIGLGLLVAAFNEAVVISTDAASAINGALNCIRSFFGGGGSTMACNTTHSGGRVQGAGKCCQLVQSGQLVPPPPGTTLPAYTPGSSGTLPANRRAQTTDSSGHCSTCMIVGSSSRKHPGKPVLRFIRGGPGCPTSGTGCCAMAGA